MSKGTNVHSECSLGKAIPGRPFVLSLGLIRSVLLFSLTLAACRSNDNKQITVGNESQLAGTIDSESLQATNGKIRVYAINREGYREEVSGFSIQDGDFDLALASGNIMPKPMTTPPEVLAFMGYTLPPEHPVFQGKFGEKAVGFARIELIGDEAAKSDAPAVPYAQLLIPVSRRSVLAGQQPLVMVGRDSGKIRIEKGFARLRVRLLDKESKAVIAGATLTSLSLDKRVPVLTGDDPNFGPVFTVTGDDGTADIFGIRSASGTEPTLQILAQSDGYCQLVTAPEPFQISQVVTRDLYLEKCDPALRKPGAFRLAFGDGIKTSTIEIDGNSAERGLVNSEKIEVKVLTASDVLRPLKIQVFDGSKASGQPVLEKKVATFTSSASVDIPAVFSAGKSGSGAFVVAIQPIFSDADRAAYGTPAVQYLYGLKSVERPVVRGEDFTFTSSAGINGIISGRGGSKFTLAYSRCRDGGEVSAWLGASAVANSDLKFVACGTEGASFVPEDVGIKTLSSGGLKTANVYFRDAYGNVNEILLSSPDGKASVYVDFGAPNLDTQPIVIGTDFGIAPKADAKGTASQAYVFTGANALTPNNLGSFVLRFANEAACKHANPSFEDGQGATDKGNLIASFVSGQNAAISQSQALETKCTDDRMLTPLDVSFPSSAGSEASIYIRVRDQAGNPSEPYRIAIPPCVNQTTTGHACWYNPP